MCPVTLPASWVASTKRCKDAGSVHSSSTGATEDAAARRVIAGQGAGGRCRVHHYDRRVTAILGLNAYHGDAAAALVVDGQLVAAAEEERVTRVNHAAAHPSL